MCKLTPNVTGSNLDFYKVVIWLVSCFFVSIIFYREKVCRRLRNSLAENDNHKKKEKKISDIRFALCLIVYQNYARSGILFWHLKDGKPQNSHNEIHAHEEIRNRSSLHCAKNVVGPGDVWWRFMRDWIKLDTFYFA